MTVKSDSSMQGDEMAMTGAAAFAGNTTGAFSVKALFAATPTPVFLVATVGLAWPGSLPTLREFSETFANIAAIVVPTLALIKIFWPQASLAQEGAAKAGGVFSALSNASGKVAGFAALALSIFAIFSWATAGKSQAAPVPTATAIKRKANDAAGDDDGTVELPGTVLDSEPAWLRQARMMAGTSERIGRKSNPKVVALFAEVGHPEIKNSIDTPWCAAFVGAMLQRAGLASTRSLMARSYEKYGVKCEPKIGAILTFWRGKYDDGATGHVGFYVGEEGPFYLVLGGNQDDSVCVERVRKSRCTSIRWPRKPTELRTAQTAGGAAISGAGSATFQTASEVMDQTASTSPGASVIVESAEALQDPLRELATWCRWAGIALAVISVGLASYAVYRRVSDYRARGV